MFCPISQIRLTFAMFCPPSPYCSMRYQPGSSARISRIASAILFVCQGFIRFARDHHILFLIDYFSGKCKNHSTEDKRQKRKLSAPKQFFCRKPPPYQIAYSHTNHIQYAEMPVWFKVCLLLCVPHQNQHYEVRKEFPQLCHDFPRKPSGRPIFSTLPFPDKLVFHIKTDFCTEDREKRDKYFIFAVQSAVQQVAKEGNTEKAKQKQRQLFFTEPAFSKYSVQREPLPQRKKDRCRTAYSRDAGSETAVSTSPGR